MPNLPPKTVVKIGKCSACGSPVEWKLNKNGIAYYYCNAGSTETFAPCSHHEKMGRANTQKMQREMLERRKAQKQTPAPDPKPEPEPEPEPAPAPPPKPAVESNWLLGA
jgi:hypothetical protein